ncbi:MAG TPA: DUF3017 domain-containing protein [Beutenbergiaceae bacterium]|nr:DUF3017 domain-containing protein [Beutenbergiaceae bacterium]
MSRNEFRPSDGYALVGIIVIGVLSILFSGRVAGLTAGIGLIVLAGLRLIGRGSRVVQARSRQFDTVFLATLGVGILVLALMADNI